MTGRYGDWTLLRRIAREARSSWPYIALTCVVALAAVPLALLTPK